MNTQDQALSKRLRAALHREGRTIAWLIAETGLSKGTIYNILSGKTSEESITHSTIEKIRKALNLKDSYVSGSYQGVSEQSLGYLPVRSLPDDAPPDRDDEHQIETLAFELSAGDGRIVPTLIEAHSPIVYRQRWFQRIGARPEHVKRVRVDGDSMEPTLYDGDYVVINLADTRLIDGRVYALVYGSDRHGRVKRMYRTPTGIRVVSDNPDKDRFPDELYDGEDADECKIIGRVIDKSGSGGL